MSGDDSGSSGNPDDPADPDGDGVVDSDNCPEVANPDQRDVDGDGAGDACDNCPGIANPPKLTMGFAAPVQRDHDQDGRGDECDLCPHLKPLVPDLDQDSDGIGDACDPEPTVANPAPYWNGFYEPPGSDWKVPENAGAKDDWEVVAVGDKVGWRQKVLDDKRHQLLLDMDRQEHHVQSSITIDALSGAVTLASATVTYGFFRQSGNDYHFTCGPRRNTSTSAELIVAAVQNGTTELDSKNTPWSGGLVGMPIAVTARATRVGGSGPGTGDSAIACDAPASPSVTLSSTLFPDGRVGLRTFGATAWFDYIFVVEPRPRM
jgi:hypothetical protein